MLLAFNYIKCFFKRKSKYLVPLKEYFEKEAYSSILRFRYLNGENDLRKYITILFNSSIFKIML